MSKKKSFREEVAEQFLKALEEKPLEWYKSWRSTDTGRAINITTNKPYKGVNSFWLKHKEYNHGYGDNRWATFKQIKDKGWKLAKGSKGEKVEFYMPIDNYIEKAISWDKYNNLSEEEKGEVITKANGKKVERYSLGTKIYTVFNASQIEDVPKLDLKLVKNSIKADEVIQRIAEGMKVEIREIENSNKPSYSPSGDYITMPKASQFNSDYYYAATALHELGHSTGHESRLNRDLTGGFGSKKYAYEELIAEITSTFMSEYIETPITEDNMKQHKAYIQSWISAIRNNKNYLFKAISKAEEASEYMIEKAELDKILENDIEKDDSEKVENCNHNTWAKLYDKIGEEMPTMEYQIPKIYKDTCKAEIENFFNETDKTWISRAELSMYAIPTTLMQFSTDELKAMRDYIDDKIFTEPKFDIVINIDEKTKEKIFDRLGFSSQREISKQKDLDMEL